MVTESPNRLTEWLDKSFRVESTKQGYISALQRFIRSVYGENALTKWDHSNVNVGSFGNVQENEEEMKKLMQQRIDELETQINRYVDDNRGFEDDMRRFIIWMDEKEYAPGSINLAASRVKKFFSRQDRDDYGIHDDDWDDIRTGLMPEFVTITHDDILTKEQMKKVFQFLPLNGKALFSLMKDSSARVGAALAIKMNDINLDADPPNVYLRKTKKGVSPREVYFTPETVEAIRAWIKEKETKHKKRGGFYDRDMLFGFSYGNARSIWYRALRKAGLENKDSATKIRVYRLHTLRKFFRTQMGQAGMNNDVIHGLMGHKEYLDDAYVRLSPKQLKETYKKYQHAVELYPPSDAERFKEQLEELERLREKQGQLDDVNGFIAMVDDNLFKVYGDTVGEKLQQIYLKISSTKNQ